MKRSIVILVTLLIAGCSKSGNVVAKDVASPPVGARALVPADAAIAPQIAYSYRFGFSVPSNQIAALERRHIGLCDEVGSARCHVVRLSGAEGSDRSGGTLELAVAAPIARRFGDTLVATTGAAGGETNDRSIEGEDLSKKIVDVEARLRGRQALADRLMEVVRTHSGSIADLVAAQRSLADVQEEIDTAHADLADAQGRVALSSIVIDYESDSGIGEQIAGSFATQRSVVGMSLGGLIVTVAALLPWAAAIGLIVFVVRWWRRRQAAAEE